MNNVLIVANWKMNPLNGKEVIDLANAVKRGVEDIGSAQVVLCPPFVFIPQVFAEGNVYVGAQDCFWEDVGAFTGEVSPGMLKSLGCSYVILGHSERKNYLGETSEMINKKLHSVLAAGLAPIVCIGEKDHVGGRGNREELQQQMQEILNGVSSRAAEKMILAYEPEWAISSNKNAVAAYPEGVAESISYMQETAQRMFGAQTPILYGGSTNSKNIRGFIEVGAAGALVGSASLDAKEFAQLVKNASS